MQKHWTELAALEAKMADHGLAAAARTAAPHRGLRCV